MTVYYLILPRPTPVAVVTKFVTKSAITRLVYEISPRSLRLATGFRDRATCVLNNFQTNSTTTDPRCHSNETWNKNDYNIACVGDICEILASNMGYRGPVKFHHNLTRWHVWLNYGCNSLSTLYSYCMGQGIKWNNFQKWQFITLWWNPIRLHVWHDIRH